MTLIINFFILQSAYSQSAGEILDNTNNSTPAIIFPDSSSVTFPSNVLSISVPPSMSLRSALLFFADVTDPKTSELRDDYQPFGLVNEAIKRTWKRRDDTFITIDNGLTLNSIDLD